MSSQQPQTVPELQLEGFFWRKTLSSAHEIFTAEDENYLSNAVRKTDPLEANAFEESISDLFKTTEIRIDLLEAAKANQLYPKMINLDYQRLTILT